MNRTPYTISLTQLGETNAVIHLPGCTIGGVYRGGDEDMLHPDDAKRIVVTWNTHDALVEVLKDMISMMERKVVTASIEQDKREAESVLWSARKALSLAEGKEQS